MEKNILEKIKEDTLYESDGDFDEFVKRYSDLLIGEVTKHMEDMRKSGYIPTEYTLLKHLGLK